MSLSDAQIENTLKQIGTALKDLRIKGGWSSYETFAIENNLDRKQYWRMENGTNVTLKSLIKVLAIHKLTFKQFLRDLE